MRKSIKALLLSLLIAASAVLSAACSDSGSGNVTTTAAAEAVTTAADSTNGEAPEETEAGGETQADDNAPKGSEEDIWSGAVYTEDTELGEGAVTVKVKVVASDKSITVTVHTDAETLGDALVENKLVSGEESEYGLYIKFVNGIEADYDKNQAYWAISKDGEYLMTGADSTPIADGENYELTYTKG